jgi:hypothetical protein
MDREGRTMFVADAHKNDGRRFVVHAEEKITAMLELERAVCIHLLSQQIKTCVHNEAPGVLALCGHNPKLSALVIRT